MAAQPPVPPLESALHRNNFDLLRLLFAGTVCLVHSYELSGFSDLYWISQLFSSVVAVKAFFVVSGFFIFMSYEKSSSLASYAGKRIRRIYPAYITIVLICAFFLVLASSRGIAEYFSFAWLKYLLANLLFLNFVQPTLPGVFEANPAAAVNGALWTLKIEVMFYASVPVFVFLFRRFKHGPVILATFVLSVAFRQWMLTLAEQTGLQLYAELGRQLPGQLPYFMAGAAVYYFHDFFRQHALKLLAAAGAILVVDGLVQSLPFLEPAALAIVVTAAGLFCHLGNFGKYGDFSYGVYIIHFPIIQLLLASKWFADQPWLFLFCTVTLTLLGAVAMWNLVEKRFLSRGGRVRTEKTNTPFATAKPIQW